MNINFSKNTLNCPKIWGFTLLALISGNALSMEMPTHNAVSIDTEAENGLTQVRKYLSNRIDTATAIAVTLQQQTDAFKGISGIMTQVTPTTTLTPVCYTSFPNKDESNKGKIKREIQTINADQTGLTCGDFIPLTAKNNSFTAGKNGAGTFNKPVQNLDPKKPGYYFILKGEDSLDQKTYVPLLKAVSRVNQYVAKGTYKTQDIPCDISEPLSFAQDKVNPHPVITFAQNVYNQAKLLRLMHVYREGLSCDRQLVSLTQKLPQEIIDREANLALLQRITIEFKNMYAIWNKAQQQNTSVASTLLTKLNGLLTEWVTNVNQSDAFNQFAQSVLTCCDNWLPQVQWHIRIEDKSYEDKKSDITTPSNLYADKTTSNENIRYNPTCWLSQCNKKTIRDMTAQFYQKPNYVPVIRNLYINSPLMIDNFVIKYGIKTESERERNSPCYALKGKIYIKIPDNNGVLKRMQNVGTKQDFYIDKVFTCAIHDEADRNRYEVFHRGHTCSNEDTHKVIEQCCIKDVHCSNNNWFCNHNQKQLAQNLDPIDGQHSPNNTINDYHAKLDQYGDYADNFENFVSDVSDSSITIMMPPMGARKWAIEIELEKPAKHNLM